jgi:hypothetical protein
VVSWFIISYETLYRCLPVVSLAVLIFSGWRRLFQSGPWKEGAACALGLLAFLSMGRMVLNAGTYHYGFFMALPALILLGVFMAGLLPQWVRPRKGRHLFSGLIILLIVFQSVRNFAESSVPEYNKKSVELKGVNGRMIAPEYIVYDAMRVAINYLTDYKRPEETLLVIPEGVTVNFLTGIPNPTSYNLFTPPELNVPGVERQLIEELKANKVDRILLINRPLQEYGSQGPGIDYAHKLMDFLAENYILEQQIGGFPYADSKRGGAVLFKRKGPVN